MYTHIYTYIHLAAREKEGNKANLELFGTKGAEQGFSAVDQVSGNEKEQKYGLQGEDVVEHLQPLLLVECIGEDRFEQMPCIKIGFYVAVLKMLQEFLVVQRQEILDEVQDCYRRAGIELKPKACLVDCRSGKLANR